MKRLSDLIDARFGERVAIDDSVDGTGTLRRLLAHRSHRAWQDRPVADDLLRTLLACALAAPSKSDLMQADVIHVRDPGQHAAVAALVPSMPWIAEAPVLLVFCANNRRIREVCAQRGHPFANDNLDAFMNAAVDAGLALASFVHAAESVGLGCCPISVIRNRAAEASALLGLPDHVFPLAALCAGYPSRERPISPRLPLSLTVHTDRYDEGDLGAAIDGYDHRRQAIKPLDPTRQRRAGELGDAPFYGWSEDKARQLSLPERPEFGGFIRARGFRLD